MKKTCIFLFGIIFLTLLFTGCGENKNEPKSRDKNFLYDVEKSIEERWENSGTGVDEDFDKLKKLVESEEERLLKYENAHFSDVRLQKIAKDYIEGLKKQKEALNYITTDANKYNDLWNQGMADRFNQIQTLINKYGIEVDKDGLEDMRGYAKVINRENEADAKVEELASKFEFQEEEVLDNWVTYSAVVENDTGLNFKYFNVKAKLLDAEDVVVETAYTNADNWGAGEKTKFKFMTESKFEKVKITKEDIDYQAE